MAGEATCETGDVQVRSMCAHERTLAVSDVAGDPGDGVTVVRDPVRNIGPVHGSDGHGIDRKVDGFGPMMLTSSVVTGDDADRPAVVCPTGDARQALSRADWTGCA